MEYPHAAIGEPYTKIATKGLRLLSGGRVIQPVMDPETIYILAGLATIATVLWFFGEKIKGEFPGLWGRLKPAPAPPPSGTAEVPTDTIRIVSYQHEAPWWHLGSSNGKPATQISAYFYVTNIIDEPVKILGCRLVPQGTDQSFDGSTGIRPQEYDMIPPGHLTEVSIDLLICPPITEEGKELVADIFLKDHFGNEHRCPPTTFAPQ